jgi:hypothetical protein
MGTAAGLLCPKFAEICKLEEISLHFLLRPPWHCGKIPPLKQKL